jgi:DNA-binding MarR family transcriptional regulator
MEDIIPYREIDQASGDAVTAIVNRWIQILPHIDPSPLLVIGRLFRLAALIDARLRPPFDEAGLSNGDFDLLAALRRQQPRHELRAGELADAMMVTTGATSKRIDRLEAQQLVTRRKCSVDGRSRLIELTDRGRIMVDQLMAIHLDNEASILCALGVENAAKLAELLGDLLSTLEPTS